MLNLIRWFPPDERFRFVIVRLYSESSDERSDLREIYFNKQFRSSIGIFFDAFLWCFYNGVLETGLWNTWRYWTPNSGKCWPSIWISLYLRSNLGRPFLTYKWKVWRYNWRSWLTVNIDQTVVVLRDLCRDSASGSPYAQNWIQSLLLHDSHNSV